ncbi:unnamed protein product [Allacma fusca]|uniref:Uncharacterized protein n=1 Tax=Allacma fusca TaxID=39272 RepID=A0A8J2JK13_9HEXA|nr:unnamed protein product [Allacma fusca]
MIVLGKKDIGGKLVCQISKSNPSSSRHLEPVKLARPNEVIQILPVSSYPILPLNVARDCGRVTVHAIYMSICGYKIRQIQMSTLKNSFVIIENN